VLCCVWVRAYYRRRLLFQGGSYSTVQDFVGLSVEVWKSWPWREGFWERGAGCNGDWVVHVGRGGEMMRSRGGVG